MGLAFLDLKYIRNICNISATLIEQEKWAPKDSTDILLAFARLRTDFNSKWRLSRGDSGQSLLRDAYY